MLATMLAETEESPNCHVLPSMSSKTLNALGVHPSCTNIQMALDIRLLNYMFAIIDKTKL